MGKRSEETPKTRLEEFMRRYNIRPIELSRASGVDRWGLHQMRVGRTDSTRRRMAAVLAGARLILPDLHIAIDDLFSFDDGPLPTARKDWQRVIAPGRPPKRGATSEKE